jgi:hypothetical protein
MAQSLLNVCFACIDYQSFSHQDSRNGLCLVTILSITTMESRGMEKKASSLSFQKELLKWEEEEAQAIAGSLGALELDLIVLDLFLFITGIKPSAKYGAVSEALRHAIPEKATCKNFCGGKKCKYCNVNNVGKWTADVMEIDGLYSNWYENSCHASPIFFKIHFQGD